MRSYMILTALAFATSIVSCALSAPVPPDRTPLPVNDYKEQLYYHPVHPHGSTGYNPGPYPTNPRLGPDPGTADYISQKPGKQHANFDPNRTPDANPTPDATRTPRPLPPVLPEDPNQEELAKAIKDMRVPDIPH